MNHDILKQVIRDQHEVIKSEKIIRRDIQLEENANYIIVGLRRSGKSTLLYHVVQKLIRDGVDWSRIIYINFEDERLSEFTKEDFNDILSVQSEWSDEPGFFFFDEIQNIDGWEKFARRMADSKERVYITGSNAKMLGHDMETTLGGRFISKQITPYSFSEYLNARDIDHTESALETTKKAAKILTSFDDYMKNGGLPESLKYNNKREYVSGIYHKVLLGDVVARNGIRNDKALDLLVKKISESICSGVPYSRLIGLLGNIGISISKESLIRYIDYLKNAYLIFDIKNYISSFSEKQTTPKYYFSDNGILNLFLYNKDTTLLENIIAIKLFREYGDTLFYYKSSKTGIDIDFYIPSTGTMIQVAYSIEGDAYDREVSNLKKAFGKIDGVSQLIIITHNESKLIQIGNAEIEVIPAFRFLLETYRYIM